jgi:hypothetical protein
MCDDRNIHTGSDYQQAQAIAGDQSRVSAAVPAHSEAASATAVWAYAQSRWVQFAGNTLAYT